MSSSLLYHAFNLKGIKYHSMDFLGNSIIISAEMTGGTVKCPDCSQKQFTLKGKKVRWLRMGPMGRKFRNGVTEMGSGLLLTLNRSK